MLPYKRAADLAEEMTQPAWLVEGIWGDGAVGILGGEPKCCKSFLALELAVATASGRACLGRFPVADPGPVLLYAAEDAHQVVRQRLQGIAAARGVDLQNLDIQVITVERLRLDQVADLEALDETVAAVKPRLLILDPFCRLHAIDENSSAEVAVILGNLRLLQRRYGTAILIVHHAKKNGGSARAGQALRGSSEFHAWGDSNLYMRRIADSLTLTIEHRAAASRSGIPLGLRGNDGRVALEIDPEEDQAAVPVPAKPTSADRIEQALTVAIQPMTLASLRQASGLRMATLCETLKSLLDAGRVQRTSVGYALAVN